MLVLKNLESLHTRLCCQSHHCTLYCFLKRSKLWSNPKDREATVAKILALQVGSYIKSHGYEKLEQFISVDTLDYEGKEIFIAGMQALLEVVRTVEMSGAEKH